MNAPDTIVADVPLLVVGAGPFGLAVAAYSEANSIPYLAVGRPMAFWRDHMPPGMILRSASDWSLDPQGLHTIENFFETTGIPSPDRSPISIRTYLAYATWFQHRSGVDVHPWTVARLDADDGRFIARTDAGVVQADNVVLAVGPYHFAFIPPDLRAVVPAERLTHTCDLVDMAAMAGRRCVIVGGRQSAFESAALLHEAGAASVDVVHRHRSPAFAAADWDWATQMMEQAEERPSWFRLLASSDRDAIVRRMWGEGRLKVEPWLGPRLQSSRVRLHPNRSIAAINSRPDGTLDVRLDNDEVLVADEVIAGTGYRTDLRLVPFLAAGNVLAQVDLDDGYPVLDPGFQTTVPGLFATGALAGRDFGPFMNFTLAARSSAVILGRAVGQRLHGQSTRATEGV